MNKNKRKLLKTLSLAGTTSLLAPILIYKQAPALINGLLPTAEAQSLSDTLYRQ
jgi:hypothetical protein